MNTTNNALKAHGAVLVTNLFFAANFSFVKLISPYPVAPIALNVLRIFFSLFLFWLLWLLARDKQGLQKKHIGRFLLCGITGVVVNQTFFIKGLTLTSTIHASLLIMVTPLVISLFAVWVLGERLTGTKGLGLFLGIGGAALLVLSKQAAALGTHPFLGDALILINAISYAAYYILVKPLMLAYSPLHVVRWVFTFGFVFILPFGWTDTAAIEWSALDATGIGALFFVVFAGTFLAYVFTAYGIRHLGAAVAGSYIYTQPVFAVAIAAFVLGETITWSKALSAVLIFAGVWLVGKKKNSEPAHSNQ